MRKINLIVLLLIFSFLRVSTAQNNVSVDPLTGSAQVHIPIWQLSDGNIGAPISVSYNGGGVRVEQGEGSAGMSWNLNAGGAVTRQLRGLPDDYTDGLTNGKRGWLYDGIASSINSFAPTSDNNFEVCSDEEDDFDFINDLNFNKDPEPDIFNFYAPGLSGQFIFDTSGNPKLINYADLKIDVTRSGGEAITEFKITNNRGVAYTFSRKEDVTRSIAPASSLTHFLTYYYQYIAPVTYTDTWHLTQISSPAGGQITFGYEDGPVVTSSEKVSVYYSSETIIYYKEYEYAQARLISIITTAINAQLTWEQNRISSILIEDNYSNDQKQFDFHYEHVRDYRPSGFTSTKAFLQSIVQVEDCASFPAYSFGYEGVDFSAHTTVLPFDSNTMQDYWGYYNGTSTTKIPDIYIYNSQSGAEKYRIQPIPGQSPDVTLTGADRSVNSQYVSAGSLTYVLYPSGAKTAIQYEPNSYFDEVVDTTFLGGGVRVKKFIVSGAESGSSNIITEYEYKLSNDESSGKLIYRPVYAFNDGDEVIRSLNNLAPDGGILYTNVAMKITGKGKTVYQFKVPATYPSTSYSTDWEAALTRIARLPANPCTDVGSLDAGYWLFPFAPNYNYDFNRGLTDRITDYAENGTKVREQIFKYASRNYNYTEIKALHYEMLDSNYIFSQYKIYAGLGNVTTVDTLRIADELIPANMLETITNYNHHYVPGLLDSMYVTNSDGEIYSTRNRYAKDFSSLTNPETSDPESVAIKNLNDNFRHGELIETYQARKEGGSFQVVGASLTLFKDFSGKTLPYKSFIYPAAPGFTKATITGSPQVLSYNSSYIQTSMIESFTSKGGVRSVKDKNKRKSGVFYGFGETTPLASVANALAEECVYDGFESAVFSLSGGTSGLVDGWAGENARSISNTTVLRKEDVTKGAAVYRFSCWAKASGSAQITFKALNGATPLGSNNVSYAGSGQWQYLEGTMDMSSVSSTFDLEVDANATVELDDIRFYPRDASMTTSSIRPLVGPTSSTDDRGISVFKEYDGLNRLRYVKDRNKDIVEVNDYRYRKIPLTPLSSNFTDNRSDPVFAGTQISFTAPSNCSGASYSWKVNGTSVSTGSSINHSFTKFGLNEVALTVSSTDGSVTTVSDVCIEPAANGAITLEEANDDTDVSKCGPFSRTVEVSLPSANFGCDDLTNISYAWYYLVSGGTYTLMDYTYGSNNSFTFDISSYVNPQNYSWFNIKCEIISTCRLYKESEKQSCSGDFELTDEQTIAFTLYTEACQ